MPDENRSAPPSGDANRETLRQNPRTNLPEQSIMGTQSTADPNEEEEDSEKPTGKVHWINHATFYLSVILAVLTAGTIRVYYLQLQQMIHVTQATEDAAYDACMSAKIARRTLLELQSGEADTHRLVAGTVAQASASTLGESAFLTVVPPGLAADPKAGQNLNLAMQLVNIGRTPAKNVKTRVTARLLKTNEEPQTFIPRKNSWTL